MSTVLYIHAWSGASATLKCHWPYFRRAGCDIIGVEPLDTACEWPEKVLVVKAGMDRPYQNGDPNLCVKLIETFNHFCSTEYTDACVVEWDSIILGPLPKHPGGLLAVNSVGPMPWAGCKGSGGFHTPWWADKWTASRIWAEGEAMLDEKDYENGSPDMFIGRLIDRSGIKWSPAPAFSVNTIDDHWLPHAKQAIRDGVLMVHGIKTEDILNRLLA